MQNNNLAKKDIHIAWSNKQDSYSYIATLKAVESLDYNPVVLDMVKLNELSYVNNLLTPDNKDEHGMLVSSSAQKVKNDWRNSNVEEITKNVKCIIFPGGSDISPTLCKKEGSWHGVKDDTEYSAERDVSDYILMSYCIEKDIPMFAICRGMQMMSVVYGGDIIGDIKTYFSQLNKNDNDIHRDPFKVNFVPHDMKVLSKDSLLYKVVNKDILTGVPSWHHQGVKGIENTSLSVVGETETDGVRIIEALEDKNKTFCLGVQFHPEVAVKKCVDQEGDADKFMNYDDGVSFIKYLASITYKE